MPDSVPTLREFIYLDADRVLSLNAQLSTLSTEHDQTPRLRQAAEQAYLAIEPALHSRATRIDASFDFGRWTADSFSDGHFIIASGTIRLLDFGWLSLALTGLPAVLRKMSKLEMEALRNSDEGRRMSKSQLQQRSQENQVAISRVEEFKVDELSDVIRRLYGDIVRIKLRPSPADHPGAMLVGSAYTAHFYDTPAALSQKYGVEISAQNWSVVGQLNVPNLTAPPQPAPVGNQMEDSFEQIALLMNNAFRLANAPAFPAVSFTPIAIYRQS